MATREQFEFFQSLYQEEERRAAELDSRAKFYFSVISLFLGASAFHLLQPGVQSQLNALVLVFASFEALLLVAALALVVLGMTTRQHYSMRAYTDGDAPTEMPGNEDFYDVCIEILSEFRTRC